MHKKITKTILLITLLVLLIGITSAATVTDNTTTNKVTKDTNTAPHPEIQKSNEKVVENKIIKKDNKNKTVKTASKTYDVTDFGALHNALTSDMYDTVNVNIKSNIKLTSNTELNEEIETLTINGNGKTIDGNNKYQFLSIDSTSTVTINNIKIINCNATNGGAIYNNGNLTITNSNLTHNNATRNGGAIYNWKGNLNITNSNLTGNNATWGGAILNKGTINITNSNLTQNTAAYGGGIYNNNTLNITKCSISKNNAEYGGGISNYCYLNITESIINNNIAKIEGGAIDNHCIVITESQSSRYVFSEYHYTKPRYTNQYGTITRFTREYKGYLTLTKSTLKDNIAEYHGGAINNVDGNNVVITNNSFLHNIAHQGSAITSRGYNNTKSIVVARKEVPAHYEGGTWIKRVEYGSNGNPVNFNDLPYYYENVGGTWVSYHYENEYEDINEIKGINVSITYNVFTQNKVTSSFTQPAIVKDGTNMTIEANIGDEKTKYSSIIDISSINVNITKNTFNDIIENITIKLKPIQGIIGETITLQANLTDSDNLQVKGGNLAFKLNGKTLRTDGRFDSSAQTMKFNVIDNGIVTYTIKADLYLRNTKNLEASYSGTSIYSETTSTPVTAQIQKRNAQVTVTTTPTRAKQYETLTFKITAKDVTKNGKNNTLIYTDTKVMLKVNGVTLKDANGKPVYVTLDKNAQATYKYTIPAGTGGITASKAQRNYKVDAIFVGDNYYPGARNTTTFQVERSTTTVTITQAKATKTNILSIKATLKDYKQNNLIGTNKVTIKINGKSYTNNGKPVYWSVKNGNVDLTGIQVDPKTTIKRVLLVTGERQAYLEGRAETTNIIRT